MIFFIFGFLGILVFVFFIEMINFNYKDGYVYLFLKYVDLINWFSVVIIFKVIYVRFEREKKLFYSFI